MKTAFSNLGLNDTLAQTVADRGYSAPTPIQDALIPSLLSGRDVVGQAQTGTGKTAAFALPMLQHLGEGTGRIRGLVLVPTRELAKQVADAVYTYGNRLGIRVLPIYGGQSYHKQTRRIKQGVDVVVGTPGRLLDLINKKAVDLSAVEVAVLDEADEMLSMGFIDDIEAILDATPKDRQTAFFSATMSNKFERLASRRLTNPEACRLKAEHRTAATIEQRAYRVRKHERTDALVRLLEVEDTDSTIVFARTRADTFQLAEALKRRGWKAGALNGEMDQRERRRMLDRFTNRSIQVLVGTNVAARGLDIDHISHVVNYELPRDPEVYVHRVGRTGRAGKSGVAISLVPGNRTGLMKKIERYTKRTVTWHDLPTEADVQAHRDVQFREKLVGLMGDADCSRERGVLSDLVAQGHDPLDVAAAALKVSRTAPGAESVPAASGDGAPSGASTGGRPSDEKGMVELRLNVGRSSGTRPGHVVGALAGGSGMPGGVIGNIQIQHGHTLVDVPEKYAQQVLDHSGAYKIGQKRVRVS